MAKPEFDRIAEVILAKHRHLWAITGGGYYTSYHDAVKSVEDALRQVYQQGRSSMREDAARVAESKYLISEGLVYHVTGNAIAEAIRKLKG